MPEVHPVTVQIAPDLVTHGFYTITGNELTMVDNEGAPVNLNGITFTHALRANDNAESIAAVLTGRIRRLLRGSTVEGFDRELSYSGAVV